MDIVLNNVNEEDLQSDGAFVVPDYVTKINGFAFENCSALKKVWVPEGVKEIRKHAFYGCKRLESVRFPKELRHIGDYAFANCPSLKSVTIPESCEVARDAFDETCEVKRFAEKKQDGRGGRAD